MPAVRKSALTRTTCVQKLLAELPDEGLRDLRALGHRTAVARAVVLRLAGRRADEMTHTSLN
jgi:hypothetical protein